jgi:hypothetical protein
MLQCLPDYAEYYIGYRQLKSDFSKGFISRTSLFVVFVVAVVLTLAVLLLPRGFSDDLTRIGQGMAVVVLTHDKNSVRSMELMDLLNKVRPDYVGIDFLAIDIDTPAGGTFIRQQGVGGVSLVMFDQSGTRLAVLDRKIGEMDLRTALDTVR